MRTSVWSLIASAACCAGCVLSPGHDLPSATEKGNSGSGDGDYLGGPVGDGDDLSSGDGDLTIGPPIVGESPCPSEGGAGGMGGACAGAAPEP